MSDILAIPIYRNNVIAVGLIAFNFLMLVALPLWLLPISIYWAVLIPLMIWVHNTHWALIHEAVHRLFSPSEKWNERVGRLLGILMGTSFHVLRFGHMMHHQYNRLWESEIHEGSRALWKSKLAYYSKLLGGLYAMEVVITLLATLCPSSLIKAIVNRTLGKAFPPAVSGALEQVFFRRAKLRQVRIDGALIILLYGSVIYLYGSYWPWLMAFVYSRALAVSFFDNIYHYATAPDNSEVAVELAMPRFISVLLLHGNYHATHHQKPNIPWHALPAHQGMPFEKTILQGARQQFNGPVLV